METYSFEHILTREAAYRALLPSNRRVLHSLAADEVAGQLVSGTAEEWSLLPQLVSHLEAAGRYSEAHARACRMLKLHADVLRHSGWDGWLARAVALWEKAQPWAARRAQAAAAGGYPPSVPLLLALNEYNWRQGRYPEALALAGQAREIATAQADYLALAQCLRAQAVLAHDQGRLAEAQSLHEESLALLEAHGLADDAARAIAVMNLGLLHDDGGRKAQAREHYERAFALFKSLGDRRGQAYSLNNIGCLLCDLGERDEAARYFEQGMALCRELGDRRGEGQLLASQAIILSELGRHSEAIAGGQAALALSLELRDKRGEAYALDSLGTFHAAAGAAAMARQYYEGALAIRREIGDQAGEELVRKHMRELGE